MNYKNISRLFLASLTPLLLSACGNDKTADAYGNFESTETVVSAEATGKLLEINAEEGSTLEKGSKAGQIDTVQLSLQKDILQAQREAALAGKSGVQTRIGVLAAKLKTARTERDRVKRLLQRKASTQQRLDQANGEVNVLEQEIRNARESYVTIESQVKVIEAQEAELADRIARATVINPTQGTVLVKLSEPGEFVSAGKPLYRIANLSVLELKAYIAETQLPELKIGQAVNVKIDEGEGMRTLNGTVSWISAEAEFTPKTIQTKKERVNLVYAFKVRVKNDGSLKIGMPAEVWLSEARNNK
ncbi:membrane protein (plasmid) [Fulvitalea axinellae]|uniref:Membrane protein n=1 Tax=Fulvitalea axinellae TaxID=1182444 RepID=A0AAU9CRM9_9BACT|nr:membrane protein [Fulvitalea axinellae]